MDALLQRFAGAGKVARRSAGVGETGERRQREDYVWRVVMRAQGLGDVQLEWKPSDLESARQRLADASTSLLPATRAEKENTETSAGQGDLKWPSEGNATLPPLTPSHSANEHLPARTLSPGALSSPGVLSEDMSVLALNHMPRTPLHDVPEGSQPGESAEQDLQRHLAKAAEAAVELAAPNKGASARPPATQPGAGEDFLGAVHSLELTRLQAHGKLDASQLPFDASTLCSLRVLRFASDDMLSEGTLESLLQRMQHAVPASPGTCFPPRQAGLDAPCLVELDLSGQRLLTCSLLESVGASGALAQLCVLRLRRTGLDKVPSGVLSGMPNLTELDCSDNRLLEVPPQLVFLLSRLEVLNLESNRLTVPSLDFRVSTSLRALLLGMNPIEILPTLGPLTSLVQFSVCSLRVSKCGPRAWAEETFASVPISAEFMASGTQAWTKIVPWCKEGEQCVKTALSLMLKSSASFHALLASFLAMLANNLRYKQLLCSESVAVGGVKGSGLRHILAMCRAPEVTLDALVALNYAVQDCETPSNLVVANMIEIMTPLLIDQIQQERSPSAVRLYAVQVLRTMASSGDRTAEKVLFGTEREALCNAASPATHAAGYGATLATAPTDERRAAQERQYKTVVGALRTLLLLESPAAGEDDVAASGCMRGLRVESEERAWLAVRACALLLIGDLAFASMCRGRLLRDGDLMQHLKELGQRLSGSTTPSSHEQGMRRCSGGELGAEQDSDGDVCMATVGPGGEGGHTRLQGVMQGMEAARGGEGKGKGKGWWGKFGISGAARRALVILGEKNVHNDGRLLPHTRASGLRILSLDGGGVKGIVAVSLLARLEKELGRPLWQVFDLVVGTSAGGITATCVSSRISMPECERLYDKVVRKAFSVLSTEHTRAAHEDEELDAATRDSRASWWQKLYQSGSSMKRLVMTGAKYDALPLTTALRECFDSAGLKSEDAMIHGALDPGRPATAIVSTLSSVRPLRPYVFRSYQLPPGVKGLYEGQCRHSWLEAMRASSAAPYFFEEFPLSTALRFQDGAIVANNPSIIAMQEARCLWPGRPVDVLVSVGTGRCPQEVSEAGSTWTNPLSMMVEAAISTERVAEAIHTLAPLIPGTSFFRMQVEDKRMSCEIDDISSDVRAGLCAAAAEYIQNNKALFSEAACALNKSMGACKLDTLAAGATDVRPWTAQEPGSGDTEQCMGGDGEGMESVSAGALRGEGMGAVARDTGKGGRWKAGIGAGIRVAVVGAASQYAGDSVEASPGLAEVRMGEVGSGEDMVLYLQGMGVDADLLGGCHAHALDPRRPCSAPGAALDLSSADEQEGEACRALLQSLLQSTANVLHFECPVEDEGLVLRWQCSALVISLAEALRVITNVAPVTNAASEIRASSRRGNPLSPISGDAQAQDAWERSQEGGVDRVGAGADAGVRVQGGGMQAGQGTETGMPESAPQDGGALAREGITVPQYQGASMLTSPRIAGQSCAPNGVGEQGGGRRGRGTGHERGQGDGLQGADRDRRLLQEQQQVLERLQACRDIKVSALERWRYVSHQSLSIAGAISTTLFLERLCAAETIAWSPFVSPKAGLVRGKVVVLTSPISQPCGTAIDAVRVRNHASTATQALAKRLVSPSEGAATALVMPEVSPALSCGKHDDMPVQGVGRTASGGSARATRAWRVGVVDGKRADAARRFVLGAFYAALWEGKSAAMAVAEGNGLLARVPGGEGARLMCFSGDFEP